MKRFYWALLSILVVMILATGVKQADNAFEQDIRAFEKLDSINPPGKGMILFVGSSSIRMWKDLDIAFQDQRILNRGFGGSETSDVNYFFDRVVKVYEPSKIVFYEGDNDIANGKTVNQVVADFQLFLGLVYKNLPGTSIGFIAIKPSPSRWDKHEEMETANTQIMKLAERSSKLEFIDVYTPMLGQNGRPLPEIFLSDSLHMNNLGYEIWRDAVGPFLNK